MYLEQLNALKTLACQLSGEPYKANGYATRTGARFIVFPAEFGSDLPSFEVTPVDEHEVRIVDNVGTDCTHEWMAMLQREYA